MNERFDSLIFVGSNSQLRDAYRLHTRLSRMGRRPFILTGYEVQIKEDRYPIRGMEYYQEIFKINYSNIRKETRNLFHSLSGEEIYADITLRQLTAYKGVSLWDLGAQYVFVELLPILYNLTILEAILNVERPSEVHVIDDVNNLEKIIGLICRKTKIHFFVYKKTDRKNLYFRKFFNGIIVCIKRLKRLLVSLYFLSSNLLKSKNRVKNCKAVFFADSERFFLSMLPVILKYNNEERLVVDTFLSGSARKMKENKIFYVDLHGYKPCSLYNRHTRNLLKKIRDAINNSPFYGRIFYKEVPIGGLIQDIFERLMGTVFPDNIETVDAVRKIISLYGPEVAVVTNSSIDFALTAKSLSIPVVAIQSGFVTEFCHFGPVIADAVTVDGNYWKEYLRKEGGVDPDKVWVAGCSKFDLLQNKKLPKPKFNLNTRVDRSKKIIVFATNYSSLAMGAIGYQRLRQMRMVCDALKSIKGAHLIIKMHPYDKDFRSCKKIAREAGLPDYTVVRDVDMLDLLRSCDLLITHLSTASYEAVLMDKNVILICHDSDFSSDDFWDFDRYGAAINVDNPADLKGHINNVLFDPETISRLRLNRRNYISEHACGMDGKAAEKVKEVIDRFM